MMFKKLAIACTLLTMMSVGVYGYLTWTPSVKSKTKPKIVKIELEPEPQDKYPQPTRITGRVVYVSVNGILGSGAVLDSKIVLTVAHVIKKQQMAMVDVGKFERKWAAARVVGRIHAKPEDIIILQLVGEDSFPKIEYFKRGAGLPLPSVMVTTKGVFPWNPGSIVSGDSGSPVLNIDGELIGLVVGYRVPGKQGVAAIFR